jgi:hypothetical protein
LKKGHRPQADMDSIPAEGILNGFVRPSASMSACLFVTAR